MKSLAIQIDEKLTTAKSERACAKSPSSDPRDAANAEERLARLTAEIEELKKEREDNLTLARSIRNSLAAFRALPLETPTRTTVCHHLMIAALLLEEEAGNKPN